MNLDEAIERFWTWWESARHRLADAIDVKRKFDDAVIADISTHVHAIGELDWELAPGRIAQHAFCLSPRGDPERRLVTELWRARGPAPDDIWEYHAARQPFDRREIVYEGVEVSVAELVVRYTVDMQREVVDATFFHPSLARLHAESRSAPVFLTLDGMFGEDGVERWFGVVDVVDHEDGTFVPLTTLATAVGELARQATGERFAFAELRSEDHGRTVVTINQALKRVDHILCCMHVAIDLTVVGGDERRLPSGEEAEALYAMEQDLQDALRNIAVPFGRETYAGHRVLHWFAPEDSHAQAVIQRWAERHADRRPQIEWIRDPRWDFAKRYR